MCVRDTLLGQLLVAACRPVHIPDPPKRTSTARENCGRKCDLCHRRTASLNGKLPDVRVRKEQLQHNPHLCFHIRISDSNRAIERCTTERLVCAYANASNFLFGLLPWISWVSCRTNDERGRFGSRALTPRTASCQLG